MNGSRSVRGFILALLCYAGARTMVIWTPDFSPAMPTVTAVATDRAIRPPAAHALARVPRPEWTTAPETSAQTTPPSAIMPPRRGDPAVPQMAALVRVRRPMPAIRPVTTATRTTTTATPSSDLMRPPGPVSGLAVRAEPVPPVPRSIPSPSRWSGYAYVFHRADRGTTAALAPAGQIGGSQAAARIAYRLGDTRLAVAARLATPLRDTRGAEAAGGVDILPLPGLRLGVERRIALGRDGRDAFAAYVAGGLYRTIGPRLELDAYGQAGLVGARRRDPFADGAIRVQHRTAIGPTTDLRFGAGAWGAAQPGAARLDIGPRVAVTARTARLPVTLAIEGRVRVAGRARPGNGVALTLASDF